jgi:hypothetical protein
LYEQIHPAAETVTKLMSNVKIWTLKGLDTIDIIGNK